MYIPKLHRQLNVYQKDQYKIDTFSWDPPRSNIIRGNAQCKQMALPLDLWGGQRACLDSDTKLRLRVNDKKEEQSEFIFLTNIDSVWNTSFGKQSCNFLLS